MICDVRPIKEGGVATVARQNPSDLILLLQLQLGARPDPKLSLFHELPGNEFPHAICVNVLLRNAHGNVLTSPDCSAELFSGKNRHSPDFDRFALQLLAGTTSHQLIECPQNTANLEKLGRLAIELLRDPKFSAPPDWQADHSAFCYVTTPTGASGYVAHAGSEAVFLQRCGRAFGTKFVTTRPSYATRPTRLAVE